MMKVRPDYDEIIRDIKGPLQCTCGEWLHTYKAGYDHHHRGHFDREVKEDALAARVEQLEMALIAFVEAYEKSLQLEKTDVAYRMAKQALEADDGH